MGITNKADYYHLGDLCESHWGWNELQGPSQGSCCHHKERFPGKGFSPVSPIMGEGQAKEFMEPGCLTAKVKVATMPT